MKLKATELPKKLSSKSLKPPHIVSIVGNEDFLQRESIRLLLERVHGGKPPEEDTLRLSGRNKPTQEDLTRLFDELRTPSLFGGDRSVVVEHAEAFLSVDTESWVQLLEQPWTGITLILSFDALDGRTKVAKRLKDQGWLIEVARPFHRPPPWKTGSPPWENELNQWVCSRARQSGLTIDPPTAHLLQTRVGTGLGDLASTVERLATFLAGRGNQITSELVEEHTRDGEESQVFELVDAFFVGDRRDLLGKVRGLLARGSVDSRGGRTTDPSGILLQFIGGSLRRARQLREVHRVQAAGGGESEMMQAAGVAKPFLPRIRQQARSTSVDSIERILDELRRADRDLKSGLGPRADELLERLCVVSVR